MDYYNEIKDKLIDNEIYMRVKDYSKERNRLITYYEVGKLLSEAGKHYGEDIIGSYSKKLIKEVGKKYNKRTLFRMKQFYDIFKNENMSTLWTQLTWSHIRETLVLKNYYEINYYLSMSVNLNLSVRNLQEKIKSKEYERLSEEKKIKLINKEENKITDLVPNPIIIRNPNNVEVISEKVLQELILEDLEHFMSELGNGFTYVGNEYKIKIGNSYNYIDLLLFNYEYNCFVVVELKIVPLKKEHIGQIEIYMNYIDKNVKKVTHDKTIGIIVSRKDNQYIVEYSTDKRIISRYYEIK